MDNTPIISIICTAFNHELYITKALEGFVMQKTNFPFEIIVHDDASTDNTSHIIREYEEKYPELFNNIYQTENQYSKGNGEVFRLAFSTANGKFIAFCEGDDYWTDPNKLQDQYDFMLEYPNCDMSFHPAKVLSDKKKFTKWNYSSKMKIYSIIDVLSSPGQFAPTASFMIKHEIISNLPNWFFQAPVGDFFLETFGSLKGGILYIPKTMSVYRLNSINSWTSRTLSQINDIKVLDFYVEMEKYLSLLKNELPSETKVHIKKKEASVIYGKALYFLTIKDYSMFRENIELSHKLFNNFSLFAKLLYSLRKFGAFSRFIYINKIRFYNG